MNENMEVLVQTLNFSLISPSPLSLAQTTPTTFGDLRLANGHSAHRRRVASGSPPSGLQDWLNVFQVRRPVLFSHRILLTADKPEEPKAIPQI